MRGRFVICHGFIYLHLFHSWNWICLESWSCICHSWTTGNKCWTEKRENPRFHPFLEIPFISFQIATLKNVKTFSLGSVFSPQQRLNECCKIKSPDDDYDDDDYDDDNDDDYDDDDDDDEDDYYYDDNK